MKCDKCKKVIKTRESYINGERLCQRCWSKNHNGDSKKHWEKWIRPEEQLKNIKQRKIKNSPINLKE